MRIAILTATIWEGSPLADALGLAPKSDDLFDGWAGIHSVSLCICGIGQQKAARAAHKLLEDKPDLLISTGYAGALKKGMAAGSLALDMMHSDRRLAAQAAQAAQEKKIICHQGSFYCSEKIVKKGREKIRLGQETGAIAVEMESQAISKPAKSKNIPFLSVRAISDEAGQDMPDIEAPWRILIKPAQWGAALRLAAGSLKARRSLGIFLKEFIYHV